MLETVHLFSLVFLCDPTMPMDPSLTPQTSRVNWSTFPLCNETPDKYLKGGEGDCGSWFQMVSVCHGGEGVVE